MCVPEQSSANQLRDCERLFSLRIYLRSLPNRSHQLNELSFLRNDILKMDLRYDSTDFPSNRSMYATIMKVIDRKIQLITRSSFVHNLDTFTLFHFVSEWIEDNCRDTISFRNHLFIRDMLNNNLKSVVRRMRYIRIFTRNLHGLRFEFPLFFAGSRDSGNKYLMQKKFVKNLEKLLSLETYDKCLVCHEENVIKQSNFAVLDSCHHIYCKSCIKGWFDMK